MPNLYDDRTIMKDTSAEARRELYHARLNEAATIKAKAEEEEKEQKELEEEVPLLEEQVKAKRKRLWDLQSGRRQGWRQQDVEGADFRARLALRPILRLQERNYTREVDAQGNQVIGYKDSDTVMIFWKRTPKQIHAYSLTAQRSDQVTRIPINGEYSFWRIHPDDLARILDGSTEKDALTPTPEEKK